MRAAVSRRSPQATREPFRVVLRRLLDQKTGGVTNISELARRLHTLRSSTKVESWRREVQEWLRKEEWVEPEDESIVLVAQAFGIDRSVFPPAVRPRSGGQKVTQLKLERLERRLQELEGQVAEIERSRETAGADLRDALKEVFARLRKLERARPSRAALQPNDD